MSRTRIVGESGDVKCEGSAETEGRILLIEDMDVLAKPAQRFLRRRQCEVTWARSAEEGRRALSDADFDLLITDIRLEDECGVEVVREWRGRGVTTPVLFVSGDFKRELLEEIREMDCARLMPKPFEMNEFWTIERAGLRGEEWAADSRKRPGNVEGECTVWDATRTA